MPKKKIYLIQESQTQLFKIGITKKDVKERVKELQIGNASTLSVIHEFPTNYNFKLEKAMHAHFKPKKVNSEWFELTFDDVKEFLNTCKKYENMYDILRNNPFI